MVESFLKELKGNNIGVVTGEFMRYLSMCLLEQYSVEMQAAEQCLHHCCPPNGEGICVVYLITYTMASAWPATLRECLC